MEIAAIHEVLRRASRDHRPVQLRLRDDTAVVGVPVRVDTDPTANEVLLHPVGDDETGIGVSLGAIASAEMV